MYSFEVVSRSDSESYFVINKPFSELYFNENVGARKAGDATSIILGAGEEKTFEFYYKDGSRGSFFVSPRLSSLVTEADIDTSCNFNEICEESLGENPDNRIISGYIIFQHEIHNLDRNKNLQFEAATESDQWKIFRINDLRSTTFDNEIRISKIEFENEPVEIIE